MITKPIKIQSKPTTKEAMQWTGDNAASIRDWMGSDLFKEFDGGVRVWNETEQQWMTVAVGHFIIRGLKGEYYPCSDEILHNSYEVVD